MCEISGCVGSDSLPWHLATLTLDGKQEAYTVPCIDKFLDRFSKVNQCRHEKILTPTCIPGAAAICRKTTRVSGHCGNPTRRWVMRIPHGLSFRLLQRGAGLSLRRSSESKGLAQESWNQHARQRHLSGSVASLVGTRSDKTVDVAKSQKKRRGYDSIDAWALQYVMEKELEPKPCSRVSLRSTSTDSQGHACSCVFCGALKQCSYTPDLHRSPG